MTAPVVGVDGGGTGTRAAVAGSDGTIVGRAEGPPSLVGPVAPEVAAGVVAAVVREAAGDAGVDLPVRALFAGLAGTGREPVRVAVERELGRIGLAERVRVGTDAGAAFHDAFADGAGVLVLAGTGSMALGRDEEGREARVGGWGSLMGDEGSGYGIGVEALRRIARGADGRGPETSLEGPVLEQLGLASPQELIRWAAAASKAEVAALVPVVVRQAGAGDPAAGEILVGAVEELEGHVVALLESLGPWEAHPRVALAGGLLRPGGPRRPGGPLRKGMETVLSRHRLVATDEEPDALRGAVALAGRLAVGPAGGPVRGPARDPMTDPMRE